MLPLGWIWYAFPLHETVGNYFFEKAGSQKGLTARKIFLKAVFTLNEL